MKKISFIFTFGIGSKYKNIACRVTVFDYPDAYREAHDIFWARFGSDWCAQLQEDTFNSEYNVADYTVVNFDELPPLSV